MKLAQQGISYLTSSFSWVDSVKKELAKCKPRGLHSPSKLDVKVSFHPAPQ